MNLDSIEYNILRVYHEHPFSMPRICLPLFKNMDIVRRVDILTAKINYNQASIKTVEVIHQPMFYPLELINEELWSFVSKEGRISFFTIDAYNYEFVRRGSIILPFITCNHGIVSVFKTEKNSIWIVCNYFAYNYHFIEIDIKTLKMLNHDCSGKCDKFFELSLDFISTSAIKSLWSVIHKMPYYINHKVPFEKFYKENIISKDVMVKLVEMGTEYFKNNKALGWTIPSSYVNKDIHILFVTNTEKNALLIYFKDVYRKIEIKNYAKYKILVRGDGAILLFDFDRNQLDIVC